MHFLKCHIYLAGTTLLRRSSLNNPSDSLNNLFKKCEQHQNDLTGYASSHNQTLQSDSLFPTSHDSVCKCEPHECDIKPDPFLHLNQDQTLDWCLKSGQSTSTISQLSQQDQEAISNNSSNECTGL